MPAERKNRRAEILEAAIRVVAQQGVNGASVRRIASEAGVTEGALYRHFASKDDLCAQAYRQIVADMAGEKERILASPAPVHEKLRDWIRVSFAYYDRYPDAFTYVLLTAHGDVEDDITRRQGRMLTQLLARAIGGGEVPPMDPAVAMSHVTGVMLNIPRLINDGTLTSPAMDYVDAATVAVWGIFGLDGSTGQRSHG